MPKQEVSIEVAGDQDEYLVYLKISVADGDKIEVGIPPEHALAISEALRKCAGGMGN